MNKIIDDRKEKILGVSGILMLLILFSTITYAATSIELTTGNFINVFGNFNLSGNNLINAGNVSIKGNLSVDGNLSIDGNTLFVDATGDRVGIGTTSPETKLHIQMANADTQALLIRRTGASEELNISSRAGIMMSANTFDLGTRSAHALRFNTNNTVQAVIDSSGNIGVGTSSPNYLLQVASGTDGRSVNLSNVLYVNGTNGSVGIGTTAPGGKLEIRNTVAGLNIRSHLVLYNQNEVDGDYTGILFESRRVAPGGKSWFGIVRTGDFGVNDFVFLNRNTADDVSATTGNEVMRITKAGNVGIGTTNPTSGTGVSRVLEISGADSGLALNSTTGGVRWNIDSQTSGKLFTSQGSTARMVIENNTGNVGIGIASPTEKLQVHGNIHIRHEGDQILRFTEADKAARWAIGVPATGSGAQTGADLVFRGNGANNLTAPEGTEYMRITSAGNVGIGTTTPASTLTITGNFSATGTKSAVVNTTYGTRKLYAMESPDIRFYDEGRARLSNGIANISLDPIFIETVEPDYQVYLTPEADTAGIYVAEKAKEYFIVKGRNKNSNIPFAWLISAVRKGYNNTRLDLERKEGIEIIAVVDEINKITDVEINENIIGNVSSNLITANVVNELNENKITINSGDEDEVIKEIQERTKISEEKIKKSITFRRKEIKELGEEEFEKTQPQQLSPQQLEMISEILSKVSIINGSIVLKIG